MAIWIWMCCVCVCDDDGRRHIADLNPIACQTKMLAVPKEFTLRKLSEMFAIEIKAGSYFIGIAYVYALNESYLFDIV